MKIQAVIFDMDGTLVDSLIYWDLLWKDIGVHFLNDPEFKPSEEVDRHVRTVVLDEAMIFIRDTYSIQATDEEIVRFAERNLDEFYRTYVKAKKGAIELLEYLKEQEIPVCIATATVGKCIPTSLQCCGLTDYFTDRVISCQDVGKGKDQPDVFLAAARLLGADVKNTVVVEDSCLALETAKKAGFHTIGIYDRYNLGHDRLEAASELYLGEGHDLTELVGVIEKM